MNFIPDNISKHDNVFDVLMERGFIEQTTHEEEIREMLGKEKIMFYIGFDPTADSLHVGHFMQVIIMMYMQKYGHTPVVLLGAGTGMVGDPSGRTDMRSLMTLEEAEENCRHFKKLFDKFLDFDEEWIYEGPKVSNEKGKMNREPMPGKAVWVNNATWLMPLKYVDFIRDIGRHFSVNNMLRAECFKQRLEKGLSFLEFNYMLMQSYDFMVLARDIGCRMQFGGNDQWSNIISGVDLTRREVGKQVYGMTFALLTTSSGQKMGKTQAGALWLNADKTSPYDFFQYWRNVEDEDVEKCLRMLTFLPMDEVQRLGSLEGEEINAAKEILAFEVTKLVHGEEEASKALSAAKALFAGGGEMDDVPFTEFAASDFEGEGMGVVELIKRCGLIKGTSEGFRLIEQGGLSLNGENITDTKLRIEENMFEEGAILIRKGKKTYHRAVLSDS